MQKILYDAMFSKIQKEIIANKEEIEKLEKIDTKYCKIEINIENLIKIIEYYKIKEIKKENKKILIYCNGNPYIVLNIAMIAITNNLSIKINIDDTMLGVNKYLLEIINRTLEKNELKTKLELFNKEENDEKIIFIDRINDFNTIKTKNKKYIPYESIDVYSEESEYEELFEKIYDYAINMNIDIDIFDDEGIESMLKYGTGKNKLILTNNKEIINKYSEKNIYINENPFKTEKIIFDENTVKEISSY